VTACTEALPAALARLATLAARLDDASGPVETAPS
jgi:hypothetical protein